MHVRFKGGRYNRLSVIRRADATLQIGWRLRALDRHEEAVEHFLEAEKTEGAAPETRAMASVALGWWHHDRGDTREKLKWFEKALDSGALEPAKVAECWWVVSRAREELGELPEAKDALENILAVGDSNSDFASRAREMLAKWNEPAPNPPPSTVTTLARDARDVICGMNGEIHWQAILPETGLYGLTIQGTWERDGDAVVVRSPEETVSLQFGEDEWEDYEVDVHVTPMEGGNAQLQVRRSSIGCYLIDMMLGWKAIQVARARPHSFERLSVVHWPVEHHREHHLRVALRGASITTYLDGTLANQVTDFEMRRGNAALVAWHATTRFRKPQFRTLS